jgi:hypothetical protein
MYPMKDPAKWSPPWYGRFRLNPLARRLPPSRSQKPLRQEPELHAALKVYTRHAFLHLATPKVRKPGITTTQLYPATRLALLLVKQRGDLTIQVIAPIGRDKSTLPVEKIHRRD